MRSYLSTTQLEAIVQLLAPLAIPLSAVQPLAKLFSRELPEGGPSSC